MKYQERKWRDYRADVSATRADALVRLAPNARAAATLAAYRAARGRVGWHKRALSAIKAVCAAI